jgi:hypothetical protein
MVACDTRQFFNYLYLYMYILGENIVYVWEIETRTLI